MNLHATVIGTGSYVPQNTITNEDLSKLVETSDDWISTRTGIRKRQITTGENTSDLAYKAAAKALEHAGIEAKELDLIICATITPDNFMPSVACMVQDKLGAVNAAAFDLTAACTGMIYAMATANSFIRNGMYQKVLVIGAEVLSKVLDWTDRSTCVLFGDGAGAVILSAAEDKAGILSFHLTSDGSKQSYLTLPAVSLSNPWLDNERDVSPAISMKGQEVFKYAVRTITDNLKTVLDKANLTDQDIKYIIPHQANQRIIEQAARSCKIPVEKFYVNLERFGNTSAATIGIALDEMVQNRMLETGDRIILMGFGGGMTSGAIILEWNR